MVQVQRGPFFELFFLGNIGLENVFYDILERRNAFQDYKNKKFQKQKKIDIFPKGLAQGLNPKLATFPTFFDAIMARKMSFTTFQNEKTPFQAKKKNKFKKSNIDIFPKRLTHGCRPKMAIFPTFFFFTQYRPRKCLLRYSRTKKRLSRL